MNVTIKDIARLAGVSHPTVSKALNNEPGVRLETRQKILQLAEQLNYVPNMAAKRLVDRKSNCIGLIWPPADSLFFYNLFKEIQRKVANAGKNVLISIADPVAALRTFNQHFIDQIVFWRAPNWKPSDGFLQEWKKFHGEMLLVGGGRMPGTHCITLDRRTGILLAMKHLFELGHRKISYVGQPSDKLLAFMEGVEEYNLDYRPEYMVRVDSKERYDEPTFMRLLNQADSPTAFIVDSSVVLFHMIKLFRQHRIRIPDDYSVIVYDETPELELFEIPLTTVGPPMELLSRKISDILLSNEKDEPLTSWIEDQVVTELTMRKSTAAPKRP